MSDTPSAEMKKLVEAAEADIAAQKAEAAPKKTVKDAVKAEPAPVTGPAYPNYLTMFDNGTPEHFMITIMPYKKSLQNEIINLQHQQRQIGDRISNLITTERAIDKMISNIANPYSGDCNVGAIGKY